MYNPKYKRNLKNGGIIPAIPDKRVAWVPTSCGDCIECRKQKARDWQLRMLEDIRDHRNGIFVTLTMSNEAITEIGARVTKAKNKINGYERDNAIAKYAVRHWLERWRKKKKRSIRHWLITELGHEGTENVHLHGIIWTEENIKEIESTWGYGHMWPTEKNIHENYVNERTVNYIIKYVTQTHPIYKGYKPIILNSAGIGGGYIKRKDAERNQYEGKKTIETYRTRTGHKVAMPNYWRHKLYSDEEREQLWVQKLDKGIRYVCGEKISIQTDDKAYWKLVEWHRQRSRELGFISPEEIWNRKEYEEQRRNMMYDERTRKPSPGGQ